MQSHPDITRVLYGAEEIAVKTRELAGRIDEDYRGVGGRVVLVGILKGAFIFLSDLCRELRTPHQVEFMAVSSYQGTHSSGSVKIVMDLRQDIAGAHVIVVEDIVDTGRTLAFLVDLLRTRGPASVQLCALVRKPSAAKVAVDVRYVGFEMDPVWVVGYGLDYEENYRTLPFIGELSKEAIEKGRKK